MRVHLLESLCLSKGYRGCSCGVHRTSNVSVKRSMSANVRIIDNHHSRFVHMDRCCRQWRCCQWRCCQLRCCHWSVCCIRSVDVDIHKRKYHRMHILEWDHVMGIVPDDGSRIDGGRRRDRLGFPSLVIRFRTILMGEPAFIASGTISTAPAHAERL